MEEQEQEQKVSKYNSGINIIMRLDDLWRKINNAVILSKYYTWNILLDRIWCELARDFKADIDKPKEEQEKFHRFETKMKEFDKNILDIGDINDNVKDDAGFEDINPTELIKRGKHYRALLEKEIFLRRLENHLGKGTAFDDEDEDGFD